MINENRREIIRAERVWGEKPLQYEERNNTGWWSGEELSNEYSYEGMKAIWPSLGDFPGISKGKWLLSIYSYK